MTAGGDGFFKKSFTWAQNAPAEHESMQLVLRYLRGLETTRSARDVSRHARYSEKGIDIVLTRGGRSQTTIDVKGDRYPEVNFFFETWSVFEEQIPGCFMASEAHEWYYCFLRTRALYVLPMSTCRDWFVAMRTANSLPYGESRVFNDDPEKGKYTTCGYPVPIRLVLRDLGPSVRRLELE